MAPSERNLVLVTFLAFGTALLVPASAGAGGRTIYHWQTEDGTYAFTDDAKAIPARYRDRAEARRLERLGGYSRYTPTVAQPAPDAESARSAEAVRLEYLRSLNAEQPPRGATTNPGTFSLRTGGGNAPVLDVTPDADSEEPVIVEEIRVRPKGRMVTRTDLVVRQGDRILTVVRPQANETNVNADIHREGEYLD